jgi:hypothetical protein
VEDAVLSWLRISMWLSLLAAAAGPAAALSTGGGGCSAEARGALGGGLTLADLDAGATITTDQGVVLAGFSIHVKGQGLTRDLTRYEVNLGPCGFEITGDAATGNGGDGRLVIRYTAMADTEFGIDETGVSVFAGSDPETMLKNKHKLYEGNQRFAVLFAKSMPGMDDLTLDLDNLNMIRVVDTIRVWGRFHDGATTRVRFCAPIPEPATGALVALGLSALGRAGRRVRNA